ncbi:SDR family NAD(P)-dependent oxidoreductase [Pollutimonas bauzanensis]|uniref:NAD(P)-dependent dehydrogenase, short-chain alcohol dehydrogenase family n=1 Tax=Pollutimonas bauzanensis TaxID=658167 RepID=A0A1M5Q9Z6_9BURK|nr:SDR family oxidoreductase [Pollutimonas bauzanensis]SHH10706.1 NAD(P)-dependent dehydrogenase, short-chain alcohol dehydrogenase family [Pollutimonas bauzanensis]
MFRLNGKVAIVTGCGTIGDGWGNGKAAAAVLARQGASIYGCDLSIEAAQQSAKVISDEGGKIHVRQCDVTDSRQVAALVKACMDAYGRIDILVNNVGRSEPGDPVTMSEETWNDQLQVNLTSSFLCCKHVIPLMQAAGGGSIINISSIAGLRYAGKPQVGYAAAKAALMQMTATTAVIYAKDGIRLNSVVPGLMFTPLVERLATKYAGGDFEGFVAHRHNQVPTGKMGDSWDVANAVAFLASDESKYITGQQLIVDGGITMATR